MSCLTLAICLSFFISISLSAISLIKNIKSNLDNNESGILIFCDIESDVLYFDVLGFAAAIITVLAGSVKLEPILFNVAVCCSITSCNAERS